VIEKAQAAIENARRQHDEKAALIENDRGIGRARRRSAEFASTTVRCERKVRAAVDWGQGRSHNGPHLCGCGRD
jgi:hypothetical protein